MKIGIVGAGHVGQATAYALALRGVASQIVLHDETEVRAAGVAFDAGEAATLGPVVEVSAGDVGALSAADLIVFAPGENEHATGADLPGGDRMLMLKPNTPKFLEAVPAVVKVAPRAALLVLSNPLDLMVELTRRLASASGTRQPVLGTGTLLDSTRLRHFTAQALRKRGLDISSASVAGLVIGEHGGHNVPLWSGVTVGGVPLEAVAKARGIDLQPLRDEVEQQVKNGNTNIIRGTGASQLGIGMVAARVAQAILRNERPVWPVSAWSAEYGLCLSLPRVLGRGGAGETLKPQMTEEEAAAFTGVLDAMRESVQQLDEVAGQR